MRSLTSLGLTRKEAFRLLTYPEDASAQNAASVLDAIFDASDRIEGGEAIIWWNDLETDSRCEF